jgi:hypothetical protein
VDAVKEVYRLMYRKLPFHLYIGFIVGPEFCAE